MRDPGQSASGGTVTRPGGGVSGPLRAALKTYRKFAHELRIDLADGSTLHLFGAGQQALREAEAVRDGWRTQPPENFYTFNPDGNRRDVFVRDITDVRLELR